MLPSLLGWAAVTAASLLALAVVDRAAVAPVLGTTLFIVLIVAAVAAFFLGGSP